MLLKVDGRRWPTIQGTENGLEGGVSDTCGGATGVGVVTGGGSYQGPNDIGSGTDVGVVQVAARIHHIPNVRDQGWESYLSQ